MVKLPQSYYSDTCSLAWLAHPASHRNDTVLWGTNPFLKEQVEQEKQNVSCQLQCVNNFFSRKPQIAFQINSCHPPSACFGHIMSLAGGCLPHRKSGLVVVEAHLRLKIIAHLLSRSPLILR